jgi:hypothetical protein
MFGAGGGWGILIAPPTLMITVGGIASALLIFVLRYPVVRLSIACAPLRTPHSRSATPPAAAKRARHTKHESEVIPVAVVLHLVDVHVRGEQRHDEGDRADQPLPQAQPEASRVRTGVDELVRSGGTCRQQERCTREQQDPPST